MFRTCERADYLPGKMAPADDDCGSVATAQCDGGGVAVTDRKRWGGRTVAGMAAIAAFASMALGAATAGTTAPARPVALAELPKGFDDYTRPRENERLPSEGGQGGGTTGSGQGGGTTGSGTGGRLTYRHILGTWCSATSTYVIGRTRLTVILASTGSRSNYRVFGFLFTADTAAVRWISSENKRVRTTFGRFSADGRRMVQLAPNRSYRRCVAPGRAPLTYKHILGSWCDVDSRYIITRNRLSVVFSGGRRVNYRVTGFSFRKDVIQMNWTDNDGKASRTRFGRYSADRRRMVQLGPNRAYRRC
jgi:hypothetical protein